MPTTPPPMPSPDMIIDCDPDSLEHHSHKCASCGHIWHHQAKPPVAFSAHLKAHTCPNCSAHPGQRPWAIYRGPGSQAALRAASVEVTVSM